MPVNLSTPGVYDGSEPEAAPPVHQTTPGVYINEVDGFSQNIVGAPTSVTAFVGLAMWGPTAENPKTIYSFSEFDAYYGGLWRESTMSYAVQQFFHNGGKEALIVRLPNGATPAQFTLPQEDGGTIVIEAATPGAWGNRLRVMIDHVGTSAPFFNLSVYLLDETLTNVVESVQYQGVSLSFIFLDYLKEGSNHHLFLRYRGGVLSNASRPTATSDTGTFDLKSLIAPTVQGVDGHPLGATDYLPANGYDQKTGIYALRKVLGFNLLCIPPYTRDTDIEKVVWDAAATFCLESDAILLVDAPRIWESTFLEFAGADQIDTSTLLGTAPKNGAVYFPRVRASDPLDPSGEAEFAPCGMVAGVITTTDTTRGVWAAPAGVMASLNGVDGLTVVANMNDIATLNVLGVNCLHAVPTLGVCIWGERTWASIYSSERTLLSVQRLTLHIKTSIASALPQVQSAPNDKHLWELVHRMVSAFMSGLYAQGAFGGATAEEAYSVKCGPDASASPQSDIVLLEVGFIPSAPAESVRLEFWQQQTG